MEDQKCSQRTIFYRDHILLVPTRSINPQHRHFLLDLHSILPHSKKTEKLKFEQLKFKLPALCERSKCRFFMVFQSLGDKLLLYAGKYPNGPTIKFNILNLHLIEDLQLAGNFSKKGRCLLSFDESFGTSIKFSLIHQMLLNCFTVAEARFSEKYIDRMMTFYSEGEVQNRVWFRHFEIMEKDLREIGPRFVLEIIEIQEGCMGGQMLYEGSMVVGETLVKKKQQKSQKKLERLMEELQAEEFGDDDENNKNSDE